MYLVYTEPFWMSARATTSGAVICFTSTEIRKYKCSIGNNGHIDNKYDCKYTIAREIYIESHNVHRFHNTINVQ